MLGVSDYMRQFVNNYNPDINWQVFMYKGMPNPIWCLNCFSVNDDASSQNLVYYYYNVSEVPESGVIDTQGIVNDSKNFTNPAQFVKFLIKKSTQCFTGIVILNSNSRIYDVGPFAQYINIPAYNFNMIVWT